MQIPPPPGYPLPSSRPPRMRPTAPVKPKGFWRGNGKWWALAACGVALLLVVMASAMAAKPRNASTPHAVAVASSSPTASPSSPEAGTPAPSASPEPSQGQAPTPSAALPSSPVPPAAPPAAGVRRPDPRFTPGEVFPQATVAVICVSGYTATVRHVTTAQKEAVYAEYGVPYPEPTGTYEFDHLIPLELGGDNANANLWPEPAAPVPGFHQKDQLENTLHALVCSGRLDLQQAQHEIATDWYAAYQKYALATAGPATSPAAVAAPAGPPADSPAPGGAPGGAPSNAIALCNDGTYSTAPSHRGACSRHGGVATYYR